MQTGGMKEKKQRKTKNDASTNNDATKLEAGHLPLQQGNYDTHMTSTYPSSQFLVLCYDLPMFFLAVVLFFVVKRLRRRDSFNDSNRGCNDIVKP